MDEKVGDDVWSDLIFLVHQVQICNQLEKLLGAGQRNLDVLKRLAQVKKVTVQPQEFQHFCLPWYHTDLGDCGWHMPGAVPYSVKKWRDKYGNGESLPGKDHVAHLLELGVVNRDGPILVVEDTRLDVRLVAEGCKRVCAAAVGELPIEAIWFSSEWSACLFPADFFPYIARKLTP